MKKFSKRFKAGLSLMLVCGMVLGNVVSANAETNIDTRSEECKLEGDVYVNPKQDQFQNDEHSKDYKLDSEPMLKSAEKAEEAAEDAAEAVKDLNEELAELGVEVGKAVTASNSAVTVAEGAERAAATASSIAASASSSAVAALGNKADYDAKVAADQAAIGDVSAEPVTDVAIAVSEAAIEAQNQADRAKELLDIALTGDAKDDTVVVDDKEMTVVEVVEEIKKAADAANGAYEVASQTAANAQVDLTNAIKEYNKYAATYGQPLYGQTEVNYLTSDGKINNEVLKLTAEELAAVEAQRARANSFNENKADALSKNIDDLTASVENAQATVDTAKKAVDAAQAAYDAAKDGIADDVKEAKDEAHDAEYLIADRLEQPMKDAQKAYADAQEKTAEKLAVLNKTREEQTAIANENRSLSNAEQAKIDNVNGRIQEQERIRNANQNSINDMEEWRVKYGGYSEIGIARKRLSDGLGTELSVYVPFVGWCGTGVWIGNSPADIAEANAIVARYNGYVTARDNANTNLTPLYNEKNGYVTAKAGYDTAVLNANNTIAEAQSNYNNAVSDEATKLSNKNSAEALYNAEMKKAENRMAKASQELVDSLKAILKSESDDINQVEYDKALNEWANDPWRYLDASFFDVIDVHDDAWTTREWMDNEYVVSKLQSYINKLGISQWISGTKKTEEVMQAIIDNCRKAMAEQEKELAAAEAVLAEQKAEAASKAAAEIANSITVASQTAVAADAAVEAAADRIETAKATVATAKAELAAAKAAVSGASLNVVDLSALKAKIATAESKLETAQEELTMAEASKKVAEYYKAWANELVTDQATRVYKWDEDNRANNYVEDGSYELKLQNNDTFYVDYITLRNYIKYVLDSDMMPKATEIYQKKINNNKTEEKVKVLYWEIAKDENGKRYLTGKAYTSVDELPNADAEYLVPYQFSCYQGQYHLDGSVITTQYVEPAPVVPTTPSNYIVTNNTVSNNTPSLDLNNDKTPEGSATETTDEQPVITVEDDKETTPQGTVPGLNLTDDITAQGALAQTGTVPVVVFYFAAVALLLAAIYFKKSFAKEN
jgi:hypothetical protein